MNRDLAKRFRSRQQISQPLLFLFYRSTLNTLLQYAPFTQLDQKSKARYTHSEYKHYNKSNGGDLKVCKQSESVLKHLSVQHQLTRTTACKYILINIHRWQKMDIYGCRCSRYIVKGTMNYIHMGWVGCLLIIETKESKRIACHVL